MRSDSPALRTRRCRPLRAPGRDSHHPLCRTRPSTQKTWASHIDTSTEPCDGAPSAPSHLRAAEVTDLTRAAPPPRRSPCRATKGTTRPSRSTTGRAMSHFTDAAGGLEPPLTATIRSSSLSVQPADSAPALIGSKKTSADSQKKRVAASNRRPLPCRRHRHGATSSDTSLVR